MAVLTAQKALNMDGSLVFAIGETTFSPMGMYPTQMRIAGTDGEAWRFTGTLSTYYNPYTYLYELTGGAVTAASYSDGVSQFSITGLSGRMALAAYGEVLAQDTAGLLGYLLAGGDQLKGSSASDTLNGHGGADRLYGGAGKDVLTGGAGRDAFVFDVAGSANADAIEDFNKAEDTIWIDNADFARVGANGPLAASAFKQASNIGASSGGTGVDRSDRILYDTDSGKLYYDSNGSGDGGRVLIATLFDTGSHPPSSLGAGDFKVI
jgi:Ca2+-binding RTX toxin-like protein